MTAGMSPEIGETPQSCSLALATGCRCGYPAQSIRVVMGVLSFDLLSQMQS